MHNEVVTMITSTTLRLAGRALPVSHSCDIDVAGFLTRRGCTGRNIPVACPGFTGNTAMPFAVYTPEDGKWDGQQEETQTGHDHPHHVAVAQ